MANTRRAGLGWAIAALTAVAVSACSVSTPRHGFTPSGAGTAGNPAGGAAAGGTAAGSAPDGSTGPVSPVGGGGGGLPGPGTTGAGPRSGSASGSGSGSGSGSTVAPGTPGQSPGSHRAAGPSAVGVTKDSITISFIAGFSGAYGVAVGEAYDEGFGTWLDDVNARGGIYGRKVVVKKVDHKETADGGVGACHETTGNGSFIAMVGEGQGEGNLTAAECLDRAGFTNLAFVPTYSPSWRHTFTIEPSGVAFGTALGSFVKNRMHDGAAKLGVIYLSAPLYQAGAQAYIRKAKALGMNVVGSEPVTVNQSSYTPQLVRLKNAGATNIAMIVTIEAQGIWRDAASLGYRPHWTGFGWTFDFITQASRNIADGSQGLAFSATSSSPAYGRWLALAKKYGHKTTLGTLALGLYGYGLILEKSLLVAGPNPTQASLEAGLETIRDWDNQINPPLTFTASNHEGTRASFPVLCCNSDYTLKSLGPALSEF